MKEIVKVLLNEGIDEETIHEVLDIIEENYEIVDEDIESAINLQYDKLKDKEDKAGRHIHDKKKRGDSITAEDTEEYKKAKDESRRFRNKYKNDLALPLED